MVGETLVFSEMFAEKVVLYAVFVASSLCGHAICDVYVHRQVLVALVFHEKPVFSVTRILFFLLDVLLALLGALFQAC